MITTGELTTGELMTGETTFTDRAAIRSSDVVAGPFFERRFFVAFGSFFGWDAVCCCLSAPVKNYIFIFIFIFI